MSFLWDMWSVARSPVTGLLGTEESRQEKVTSLLVDKPFQFGADMGLYNAEKIATPQHKERTSVYDLTTDIQNMGEDTEVFRKNLPANLAEIGTGLIDIVMNPVKSADKFLDLTSGAIRNTIPDDSLLGKGLDITDKMVGYDGMADRELAAQVYNDAKTFFATEGAMRDFALQNPADLVAILLGSAYGINKIKNISPEKKAEVESIVKRIGATPVGLTMDVNYGGSHRPPGPDGGAPGHNVTTGSDGGVFPNDIYSDKALQYYKTGDANDTEAINIINSMKGNPDMDVTIYRAVPNESNITDINNGDWVTTVKSYADDHAATGYGNRGNEPGKVLSKTVKAKDIFTNGDSIMEWGYSPIIDEIKPKTIYHGTNIKFDEFDLDKTADGTVWFTSNREKLESGQYDGVGSAKYIVERKIDEGKLKLADWDLYDKHSTQELMDMGYDGLKLVDKDEITYRIFDPTKLERVKPKPFVDAAGTYSKAEQTVLNMSQGSMGVKEVIPYLQNRGILNSEIKDLKIDRYIDDFEGAKVTKQGLLDHIDQNQTQLLSTSLLSPNHTSVNAIVVNNPYGHEFQQHRNPGDPYEYGDIATLNGTLRVAENPDAIEEIHDNMRADIIGSYEVNAEDALDQLKLKGRENFRSHYPFNFITEDAYSTSAAQGFAISEDNKMARVLFEMHKAKPEKYPLTHGLEAYINNQSIDALEKPNTENQPAITQMLEENKTSLTALQELNNTGVEQWDQILSKALHETKPPSKAIDRGLSMGGAFATMDEALDFDDALSTVAEEEYLYDPTFEQSIVVKQDEDGNDIKYTVAGNDTNGWFVYDPSMNIIADSVDLPRAQAILNQDAQNRDYVRAVDKNEVTEESLYHNYLSSKDAKFVDTYSEELISLVPNTTKKSKYYQGSVIGGEGYEYDQGHYAKVPNTLTSYRKIIVPANSVKKRDGTNADSDVYKIVEAQSDWIQDGRQYGFTQAEYDEIGDQIRVQGRDLRSYRTAISVFEDTMDEYDVNPDDKTHLDTAWAALQDVPNYVFKAAFITNFKKTSHKGVLNLHGGGSGLSTAKMNSDEFKQAMDEFDVNSKKVEKSINARWENNEYNPDSANFDIHKYSETRMFSDVEDYLVNQQDILDQKRDGWEDHTVSPRTPLKDKNTYLAMTLQDAIQKAHSKGLKYVSWSSGSQILDRWNRSRDLDKKGNIKYKELYSNIYDRGLPKEAKKFLNKYNAGALQEMEVDGQKQYVIEITDELIEALQKDFDLPKDSTMLPMPKYGKANNIPSGLLKTDITNQEGLLV